VPAHARPLILESKSHLRTKPISGCVGSAKKRDCFNGRASAQELLRQFESGRAACAIASNYIRTLWLKRFGLGGEVSRQFFYAPQRFGLAIQPRRLQAEEWLLIAQILRKRAITENIPVVPGDGKNRCAGAMRAQRNYGALLAGERLPLIQEFEYVSFALAEFFAELGAQCSRRRAASQLPAFSPNLDVATAKCR
jgi:hypothetical protein